MKVSELIRRLQTVAYPDHVEVVLSCRGLPSVIGSRGGVCPKVTYANHGIDHDSGFVFLQVDQPVTLCPAPKKRGRK